MGECRFSYSRYPRQKERYAVYGQLLPWPDLSPRNEVPVCIDCEVGWDQEQASLSLTGTKHGSSSP